MKTPYFRFHPEKLIQNYNNFEKNCKENFSDNFHICYSVKTNTDSLVIKTLEKLNSGFETASLRELKLTPKKSFRVMNGPAKTMEELNFAIKNNVLIFIDSFSELNHLIKIGKENPSIKKHFFGIRLGRENSKFGFGKNQLKEAFKIAKENNINIEAIQLHEGTLNKISEFQKKLKEQSKIIEPYLKQIKFLDFGGGYPDNFQLKNLGLKLNDYLKEIKNNFSNFKGIFIFEPGRNLVSDAYTLITKVIAIKEKDNEDYAILDAGINILSKITLANFKFNKLPSPTIKLEMSLIKDKINKEKTKIYTLAGPLLFNNDIIGKYSGILHEGDLFEVENVGAYCKNLSWEIIYERPKTY